MATLNTVWFLLQSGKVNLSLLGAVDTKAPREAEGEEVVVFRAWKDRPLLSFGKEAYKKLYAFLRPFQKDLPPALVKLIVSFEEIGQGDEREIRRRALTQGRLIGGRVVMPQSLLSDLNVWLEGRAGRRGGSARNAIERLLKPEGEATAPSSGYHPTKSIVQEPELALGQTTNAQRRHVVIEEEMRPFVEGFLAEAAKNNGQVGRRTLGGLIREYNLTADAASLAKTGWLIPKIGEGKKRIGAYEAGEKMYTLLSAREAAVASDDPLLRARALIEQKQAILERKAALERELAQCENDLVIIDQAEKLIYQLSNLMSPPPKA